MRLQLLALPLGAKRLVLRQRITLLLYDSLGTVQGCAKHWMQASFKFRNAPEAAHTTTAWLTVAFLVHPRKLFLQSHGLRLALRSSCASCSCSRLVVAAVPQGSCKCSFELVHALTQALALSLRAFHRGRQGSDLGIFKEM